MWCSEEEDEKVIFLLYSLSLRWCSLGFVFFHQQYMITIFTTATTATLITTTIYATTASKTISALYHCHDLHNLQHTPTSPTISNRSTSYVLHLLNSYYLSGAVLNVSYLLPTVSIFIKSG